MRIAYANAMDFKTVIEALSKLIDEVTFTFTSSGLDVVAVDRAHISLIKLHFPRKPLRNSMLRINSDLVSIPSTC